MDEYFLNSLEGKWNAMSSDVIETGTSIFSEIEKGVLSFSTRIYELPPEIETYGDNVTGFIDSTMRNISMDFEFPLTTRLVEHTTSNISSVYNNASSFLSVQVNSTQTWVNELNLANNIEELEARFTSLLTDGYTILSDLNYTDQRIWLLALLLFLFVTVGRLGGSKDNKDFDSSCVT